MLSSSVLFKVNQGARPLAHRATYGSGNLEQGIGGTAPHCQNFGPMGSPGPCELDLVPNPSMHAGGRKQCQACCGEWVAPCSGVPTLVQWG